MPQGPRTPIRAPVMNERHKTLLQNHCIKCHNADKAKGKFRVDSLPFVITTRESAERWQKVLNALNSGAMPPEEETQPDSKAKADFLEDLAQAMVAARRNLADQQRRDHDAPAQSPRVPEHAPRVAWRRN